MAKKKANKQDEQETTSASPTDAETELNNAISEFERITGVSLSD